jgi:phosphodiesterase/alkaline phosphatase D-like protein
MGEKELGSINCYRRLLLFTGTVLLCLCMGCTVSSSINPGQTSTGANNAALPDLSDIQANGITSSGVVITWTAGKPLTGLIEWGKTTAYEFNRPVSGQPGIQQPVMLSGLKPGTTYHYRFTLKDAGGTAVTSVDQTFSTLEQLSGSTLALSKIGLGRIADVKAAIAWTSDVPATGQVEYGKSTSYGSMTTVDGSYVKDHLIELTQLSPNTVYHYRVISRNKSGSETVSMDQSFTTADPADRTAPVISDISITGVTYDSATINWVTGELASSQVEYGTNISYGNTYSPDDTTVYNHTVTLVDLDYSKTYHFRIISADWAGNVSISPDDTFVTDSTPRVLGNSGSQKSHCACEQHKYIP